MKPRIAARAGWEKANASYWIEKLGLEPHPEGGYFRQTYKAEMMVQPSAGSDAAESHSVARAATRVGPPAELFAARAASTAIYFLLEGDNFSAFHRLRSDEMWHFYAGSPLVVHVIDPSGEYSSIWLGDDREREEVFQAVVKAGCWFASEISQNSHVPRERRDASTGSEQTIGRATYALVGCTVAPGFEFEDFELGKREDLARAYPQHRKLIERLTRE